MDQIGYGTVIGGILTGTIGIAILTIALMYHRRKVAHLKMEIAQVQYIAEPVTPPGKQTECFQIYYIWIIFVGNVFKSDYFIFLDRSHFDNPVYTYQENFSVDKGTDTLLNTEEIQSILSKKIGNSENEKLEFGNGMDDGKGNFFVLFCIMSIRYALIDKWLISFSL